MTARAAALALLLCAACATGPGSYSAMPREIELTAWQWGYEPTLVHVRVGQLVRLHASSLDVEHSLTCADLGIDAVIPPRGATTTIVEFRPERTGDYIFQCTKDCGPARSRMQLRLVVVPR